ncbi:MAG TPA: DUF6599 family protein [Acidobacteriaceae bacterium]|nr:DUF6599 family protein [Acidobacteriaceae bacterium]
MLVEPPAPLLPATLDKLSRVSEGDIGDGLGSVDPAQAPVLKEDGLRRFAQSDYSPSQNKDAHPHANIAVYQFTDVSGAISGYDYFAKPGMRPEKLGDTAASSGDELVMRSGKNVVLEHWKGGREEMPAVTRELIEHLPKATGNAGLSPLLPTMLPAKGLEPESIKYALGPVGYKAMGGAVPEQAVGFQKSAEAVTAKYKGGGELTLVLYPTPQIAGEFAHDIQSSLSNASGFKLRREGPLVALATGGWPAGQAQKMVDGVHLRTELSFDKPMPLEFHTEVQKTYSLLESIAIFCGLGALAAVVLGLFFGGGRALIRVMQGKPAATEPEFLRIDLRGIGAHPWKDPQS